MLIKKINIRSQLNVLANVFEAQDKWLLGAFTSLCLLGWIMVASASSDFAAQTLGNINYFTDRQGLFLLLGFIAMLVVCFIPSNIWQEYSFWFLLLTTIALILVALVGYEVNGSKRWLPLPFFKPQPSEFFKVAAVLYVASFIQRNLLLIRERGFSIVRPMGMLSVGLLLILFQPDFGTVALVSAMTITLWFLASPPWKPTLVGMAAIIVIFGLLVMSADYRLQRLTNYLDPWSDRFGAGYQVTQSLMAFGQGHWFGVGFGNSIQKLMFLPEAHTDFVFAIWAEEMGLLGALIVIGLYTLLVTRIMLLGRRAENRGQVFIGFVFYGAGMLFAMQAFINIAVTCGLLPTKGITLPFISYGGSSLLAYMSLFGVLMRMQLALKENVTISDSSVVKRRKTDVKDELNNDVVEL